MSWLTAFMWPKYILLLISNANVEQERRRRTLFAFMENVIYKGRILTAPSQVDTCPFLCLHWFLSMAVFQRDRVQTEPIISNSASPLYHVLGHWMKECCVFWPCAPLSQQMRESFTLGHKTKSHSWWKAPVIEKKTSNSESSLMKSEINARTLNIWSQ